MVFQTGLFDDQTAQDALTIVVLYAAQLDTKGCQEEIDKISDFLNSDAFHIINQYPTTKIPPCKTPR